MNELTPFLAAAVVLSHLAVIFWPRKPLPGPTDKNGMPIVWRNDTEERKDVACIWRGAEEIPAHIPVPEGETERRSA